MKSDTWQWIVIAVCVVVVYFMFLICLCILVIVLTIIVQHLYLRSESVPFVAMPVWVSCKCSRTCHNIFHFGPHHQHYGARCGLFLHMFILSRDCGSIKTVVGDWWGMQNNWSHLGHDSLQSLELCIRWGTSTYGHHLVNTIQWSVLSSDAGCCYSYCSNFFKTKSIVSTKFTKLEIHGKA